MGKKRLTQEEFEERVRQIHGDKYIVLGVYKNNKSKIKMYCTIHDITWYPLAQDILKGKGCKQCGYEKVSHKTRLTQDEFEARIKYIWGDEYKVIGEYINSTTKIKMYCETHGEFYGIPNNLLQGQGCKKCGYNTMAKKQLGENNHMYGMKGENHPRYNPNLTDEEREKGRHIEGYEEWRKQVFERDNYTCQCCGDNKGSNLNAHHKNGYYWDKEHRTDIDNGVTLCEGCHREFHEKYGRGNNTEEQYIEFLTNRYLGDVI